MQPEVSIIIPVFNSGKSLAATLDSIKEQSLRSWECVLVDDGSVDDSVEIAARKVQQDSRFRSVSRPKDRPKGASSCRNFGLSLALGKFIQYFDADDLMFPNHLSMKVATMKETEADVVVCRLREVFNGGEKTRINDIEIKANPSDLVEGHVNWYVCGPIWRKDRISDVRFPEDVSNLDDLVFNLRALRAVRKVAYLPEFLIDYLRHGQGITGAYSKSSVKEIKSTIFARRLICHELQLAGQYDACASRAQLNAIVHLGYLTGTSRNPKLIVDYMRLIGESTLFDSSRRSLKILLALIIWFVSGKGYALVRWLKT